MNLFEETKFIMNKYHITANKGYGQNFLIDDSIVKNIIEKANVSKDDLVIEIGPGLGNLTLPLLEKAGKVICVELDPKMITVLNDRFSMYSNFELINDDILKINIKKIIEDSNHKKAKIVANLPYYITTPIIMKLLEEQLPLESITVMVQKEVAERLAEKPGGKDTGAITYTINYYTKPEIVLNVPRDCFIPAPKVDSSVIQLNILNNPPIEISDKKQFFKIINLAFLQKRKTLVNSLSNSGIKDKNYLENMLINLNIDTLIRAEQLSLEDFKKIAEYMIKNS
jgi:16S rRNA (adenine1518-N6/adenine1519-N6)-dimethyltransferase